MKKRLLSIVLSLVMILGVCPVTAAAAYTPTTTHKHYLCGASCAHDTSTSSGQQKHSYETFTAVSSESELKTKLANGGSYYLTKDIAVTDTVDLSTNKKATRCLNGHVIYWKSSAEKSKLWLSAAFTLRLPLSAKIASSSEIGKAFFLSLS